MDEVECARIYGRRARELSNENTRLKAENTRLKEMLYEEDRMTITEALMDREAITKERDRLKELLDEVRLSGVESDLPGIDYVTVQIDRELWQALQEEES